MGERSSWAVSETSERCRCWAEVSRESMSLSVSASDRTSSRASGTGRSAGTPVPVTRAAPRRMRSIGRRVEPTASQVAPMNTMNSTGVPKISPCATTCRLSAAELYGTAAITSSPSSARTTATRSSDGMSNGAPGHEDRRVAVGERRRLRGRHHRHQPVGVGRHVDDLPRRREHLDGDGPGRDRHRVGEPVALISAATSVAPDRAVSSTDRVSETRSVLNSSRSPATSATSRPRAAMRVTRARRPRRRHQRTSTGPRPCRSHHRPSRRARAAEPPRRGRRAAGAAPGRSAGLVSHRRPPAGSPPRGRSSRPPARRARRSSAAGTRRRPRRR